MWHIFVLFPKWQRRVSWMLAGYTVTAFISILVAFGGSSLWFAATFTGLLSFAGIACSINVLMRGRTPVAGMTPRTEPLPGDMVHELEVAFGSFTRHLKFIGKDQLLPLVAMAPGALIVIYIAIAALLWSALLFPP